jgi:predicted Rossmann fold nucleotide-binding protein DprA/Smf involved in DNA uptake
LTHLSLGSGQIQVDIKHIAKSDPEYPASLTRFLATDAPGSAAAIGNLGILTRRKLAIFCSAVCPETLASQAYELMYKLAIGDVTTIGGFHSRVEKSCLQILLRGAQPIIISPARSLDKLRVRSDYRQALKEERLLFLSFFKHHRHRSDVAMAFKRNRFVAALADMTLILHAAPSSNTERLCRELIGWQRSVYTLDSGANENLLRLGAQAFASDQLSELIVDYNRPIET